MPTLKFVATTAESLLALPGKQVDYFDAGANIPGFGLRVGGAKKTWFLLYRVNGRLRRVKVGTCPPMKLAAARAQARRTWLGLQVEDIDPAAAKKARRSAITFDDLADKFITDYAKPRKKTWDDDARHLRVHCRPRWRGAASEVTRSEVSRLLTTVAAERGGTTANRLKATLSKLFRWAVAQGHLEANPMAGLPAPAKERSRDRALTDPEVCQFWTALSEAEARPADDPGHIAPEVALWMRLRLLTAQRGGEVAAMKWADLDLRRRIWELPAAATKANRAHIVPLAPWLVSMLQARRAVVEPEQVYVLAGGRARAVRQGVTKVIGLPDFTPHDLRRTAATGMARLGASRFVISRVLNHADPSVTGVYDRHEYLAEKRHALTVWAKHVRAIVGRAG